MRLKICEIQEQATSIKRSLVLSKKSVFQINSNCALSHAGQLVERYRVRF